MRIEGVIGVKEVAGRLGVSRVTVWRMVKDGRLKPSLIIDKRVYFQETDFREKEE